jgi:hypothetical protein
VTGYWRKFLSEELRDLYSSRHSVRMIKSRGIRRAGHVARFVGRGDMRIEFW